MLRFTIVCFTVGLFCFLTSVSLRSLVVLRKPSMCFGGNNYEIRFSFVVSRETMHVLKQYASRTLWKTQTPHLADETLSRCTQRHPVAILGMRGEQARMRDLGQGLENRGMMTKS